MVLSITQEKALERILEGETIFLTGSPGTGKSYLLHVIIKKLFHKNLGITATTGCAAGRTGSATKPCFRAGRGGGTRASTRVES